MEKKCDVKKAGEFEWYETVNMDGQDSLHAMHFLRGRFFSKFGFYFPEYRINREDCPSEIKLVPESLRIFFYCVGTSNVVIFWTGYSLWKIAVSTKEQRDALIAFAKEYLINK